ncbi:hypothetical protein C7974DRAFT_379488 [Boeremia exigua]|uniref:uncharacterized protein n=1 Tax=Boeremia exigua TaxID=749465 RepID=UPI001E8DB165|nr:uncharacterized protein C7974DRAFT_379488 [Boeremia exigua]KAH6616609.1 hypothetical protein C7974DRAFT_379488 [Boeremia exigua]
MNLDGSSDSKPIHELDHDHISGRQPEHKPTKLRRFMSIGSRSRGNKVYGELYMNTASSRTPPLQPLSFRYAESESRNKKQIKRSISSFFLSKTSTDSPEPTKGGNQLRTAQSRVPVTKSLSLSLLPTATTGDWGSLKDREYLPHTAKPYQTAQMQPRKDSATKSFYDMPTAMSRNAALTSHPVREEDLASEDKAQVSGKLWGRRQGEPGRKVTW